MNAIVVYESMWGNTAAVARAVAEGLGEDTVLAEIADGAGMPPVVDAQLVVVGGPTHAFSMSRPSTRADALKQGARARNTERGVREWLDSLPPSDRPVATFDTRVAKVRRLPGSAARKAAKEVRRRHLGRVIDTESFYVEDVDGPLLDGELQRARDWGARLSAADPGARTS
jgi:hypothetical protein